MGIFNKIKSKIIKELNKPFKKPTFNEFVKGGPITGSHTFCVICRRDFDIRIPNAGTTSRIGFCNGFAEIGIGYRFLGTQEISKNLSQIKNPILFLSGSDYEEFSVSDLEAIKKTPHFVWVSPNFEAYKIAMKKYQITYKPTSKKIIKRICKSEPNFVWGNVTESGLEHYTDWAHMGLKVKAIPFACDIARYYPQVEDKQYSEIKMAFVGGYWARKAIQFDKYLKPYENKLSVFGYSPWPYSDYRGQISMDKEKILYHNARLCPSISEPHAEVTGDIVERVFKIMGSGGCAVTDVIPHYKELFTKEELLYPESIDEYHDMVKSALEDDAINKKYRENGLQAILDKHTYAHRAKKILSYLDLNVK